MSNTDFRGSPALHPTETRVLQTKCPLGDPSSWPPRPFRKSPINSVWHETEAREEKGDVDEWTQTFTDFNMFALAVYFKMKEHKIFIAELLRGSSDTEITIYVYVKQVLLATPADLRQIWSRFGFWICWRKIGLKIKHRPINKSHTSTTAGWCWFSRGIIWIFLGTIVLLFYKIIAFSKWNISVCCLNLHNNPAFARLGRNPCIIPVSTEVFPWQFVPLKRINLKQLSSCFSGLCE